MPKTKLAALALLFPLLAACSETGPKPQAATPPPPPPADATRITGNWCSPAGGRFSISQDRFDSRENKCAITRLANYEGTYTASLACEGEGQTSQEDVTISPVGKSLHITFLSRAGKRAIVNPC